MYKLIFPVLLMALLVSPEFSFADLEDVESDMEEAMGESEAAREESKAARGRAEKEKVARDKEKAAAIEAAAKARAKERESKQEIAAAEREYERIKSETAKFVKERTAFEAQIVKLDKKIADKKAEVEKTNRDREAALVVRDEAKNRTAEVMAQANELEEAMKKTKDAERMAMVELEEAKKAEKEAGQKLVLAEADNKKNLVKHQERIDNLKSEIHKAQESVASSETQMRTLRQKMDKAEEDASIAEGETEQAKRRAEEAKQRLGDVRASTHARQQAAQARKANAQGTAKGLESTEAHQRVEAASAQQSYDQVVASADAGSVGVQMAKKKTGPRKLSLDCTFREKPKSSAKVIFKKKKGQSVVTQAFGTQWAQVLLNGKTKAYAPANCFEARTPSMQ